MVLYLKKQYYLHFRNVPKQETLSTLAESNIVLESVFETSFDVETQLSYSALLHLLKSQCPQEEYRLLSIYKASTCAPGQD